MDFLSGSTKKYWSWASFVTGAALGLVGGTVARIVTSATAAITKKGASK